VHKLPDKVVTSKGEQVSAPAAVPQQKTKALAQTGVNTPRLAVFGAALLVFGAILMTLSRAVSRR
jgi:hypothetical protein